MTADDPPRITVSRDALRADLAEMELRLQAFVRAELSAKADRTDFITMRMELDQLNRATAARDRGEFTVAQQRAITAQLKESANDVWTWRQQAATVVSAGAATVALLISLAIALHGGTP